MPDAAASCTVATVMTELGGRARLVRGALSTTRPVHRADIWLDGDDIPDGENTLIVCRADRLEALAPLLDHTGSRMIAVRLLDGTIASALPERHVLIVLGHDVNLGDVVAVVARATRSADEQTSRRLIRLQRSLSGALADPEPAAALLTQLKRTCQATIALFDIEGRATRSTGPLPAALLHDQLRHDDSPTVLLDIDGWRGVARRIDDLDEARPAGWLVAAARRQAFPDPFTNAAVEIGAAVLEAAQRIARTERAQDRAVRASVLEQLLALQITRDDPELTGRVAGLGTRFDDELRVLMIRPVLAAAADRRPLEALGTAIGQMLRTARVTELISVRDDHVVVLAQCTPAAARRLLVAAGAADDVQVGVGRRVESVGEVVDSYNDAHLALRSLQRQPGRSGFVAFEDFDFATRLFSNVGLDRMVAWAQQFFRPLVGRDALVAALQAYFDRGLNIKAAANDLFVHHNSLRYRLSKVEDLLGISLGDPAAISSTYLALTALDLVGDPSVAAHPVTQRVDVGEVDVREVDAGDTNAGPGEAATDLSDPNPSDFGVAHGPER